MKNTIYIKVILLFRLFVAAVTLVKLLAGLVKGASMLRTKGEPGTGNIVEAVRHMRKVNAQVRKVAAMNEDELMTEAKLSRCAI